jgi:5-methylcytosine-specific restriction endonuclease McrA
MPMHPSKRQRRKKKLLRRDGACCAECRAPNRAPIKHRNRKGEMESRSFLTVDHIVPTRDGGTDDLENLRLLCEHCHRKHDNMRRGGIHPDTGQISKDYVANSREFKRFLGAQNPRLQRKGNSEK